MGYHRKAIITCTVIAALVGIALAVFFLIPRNPSVDFQDPTYTNVTNTETLFSVTITIPFTVDNPNYYDLHMNHLDLEVDYNDVYLSRILQSDNYTFKKRGTTASSIESTLSTTDSSMLAQIQSDLTSGQSLHLTFTGYAKFQAMHISVKHNLSFSKDIQINTL